MGEDSKTRESNSSEDIKVSVDAFQKADGNLFKGLLHLLRGFWVWVREQHPFVQAIITLPLTFIVTRIADIFAEGIYTTFWAKSIPVNGSLHVTGLPVPISIAIYFLLILLAITMVSNYNNQKEIERLKSQIQTEGREK